MNRSDDLPSTYQYTGWSIRVRIVMSAFVLFVGLFLGFEFYHVNFLTWYVIGFSASAVGFSVVLIKDWQLSSQVAAHHAPEVALVLSFGGLFGGILNLHSALISVPVWFLVFFLLFWAIGWFRTHEGSLSAAIDAFLFTIPYLVGVIVSLFFR